MDALGGDEQLLLQAVAVGVTEHNAGEGSTTARVVDDLPHNALLFAKGKRRGETFGENGDAR